MSIGKAKDNFSSIWCCSALSIFKHGVKHSNNRSINVLFVNYRQTRDVWDINPHTHIYIHTVFDAQNR